MTEKKMGAGEAIVTLLIGGAAVWYLWGGGFEKQTTKSMEDAEKKVAQSMEDTQKKVAQSMEDTQKKVAQSIEDAQKKMAQDLEEQYDIVSRNGSATDKCMHANIVAGSYLSNKDEPNYVKWKKIANADCKAIGVNLD